MRRWLLTSRLVHFGNFMSVSRENFKEQLHDDPPVGGRTCPRSSGSWSASFQSHLWKIPRAAEDLVPAVSPTVQRPAEGSLQGQHLPDICCASVFPVVSFHLPFLMLTVTLHQSHLISMIRLRTLAVKEVKSLTPYRTAAK